MKEDGGSLHSLHSVHHYSGSVATRWRSAAILRSWVLGGGSDGHGASSGAAYIFDRSTGWSQVAKLTASDQERGDEFGYSVAISGDLAIVGARLDWDNGSASGASYVFDGSAGWSQVARLSPADAAANDQLGTSVAIVGAPGDRDGGVDSGSVFMRRRAGLGSGVLAWHGPMCYQSS